jgi:hypothetical protein
MLRGEDHEKFLKKNNIVLSGEHIALSPIVANFGKRCGVWTAE